MKKITSQNGNAIVMILIAVALFAALSLAFSNTSRTSSSFISDEEAKAYAHEIIAYSNEIQQGVKRLFLRGCAKNEITFFNTIQTGHDNIKSPDDGSCHIFSPNGAGLTYKLPNKQSSNASPVHNHYILNSFNTLYDPINSLRIGSFAGDLVFMAEIREKICIIINNSLNVTPKYSLITDANGWNNHTNIRFTGNYTTFETMEVYPEEVKAGCIRYGVTGPQQNRYFYYKHLVIN